MFLSLPWRALRKLNVRIFLVFSALFILSSGVIFFLSYGMLSNFLTTKSRHLIEAKTEEYAAIYGSGGVNGLKEAVETKNQESDTPLFLIRIASKEGISVFFHGPVDNNHFDLAAVEAELTRKPEDKAWIFISSSADDDQLEIFTKKLPDGLFLQTGGSSDDRKDLLEHIRNIFLLGLLATILVAGIGGTYLSRSFLRPIRNLISTIESIQEGDLKARAHGNNSEDELQKMASLFNGMLDQIETLMRAMQETQDNVAHDLRTPVTRFRSIAEMALEGPPSELKFREALGEGLECSEEILTLINTLMEITEAEVGALRLDFASINVAEVIAEVFDLYAMPAEDKQISLAAIGDSKLAVRADRHYLKRVLSNLIDNALKYSEPGSKIEVSTQAAGTQISISVSDTGEGIEAKDLPFIWDRLYRADKSRSKQGLGLGLSLVKSITGAHHGVVTVASEAGKGSRFTVTLPAS